MLVGLPTTLWITAQTASDLQFTAASIANAAADEVLTLRLNLPASATALALDDTRSQGLSAVPSGGVVLDTAESTARTLVLKGTAAQLQAFIVTAGALRYAGPALASSGAPLDLQI